MLYQNLLYFTDFTLFFMYNAITGYQQYLIDKGTGVKGAGTGVKGLGIGEDGAGDGGRGGGGTEILGAGVIPKFVVFY